MPAANLADYEWQLGDGPVFGFGDDVPVGVIEVDYGTTGYVTQDENAAGSDGVRFGVDYMGAPQWVLSIATRAADDGAGLSALESIVGAWKSSAARLRPGDVESLAYGLAGRRRVVFGRPRNTSPAVPGRPTIDQGTTFADLAFQLRDPRVFDAVERSITLSLRTQSEGGWISPTVAPIISAPSGEQAGVIDDVGGTTETPATVTIYGPIAQPWVEGPGWRVSLDTSIAFDQSVTIDARPWITSVLRSDGASLAGRLSRRTRLADVSLSPGGAGLTFGGVDPTATSQAVVSWRPAHHSI